MGAVFFAAIVFAGFLAALRAAGFVPAAFFFSDASRGRVAFTATFGRDAATDRRPASARSATPLREGAALLRAALAGIFALSFAAVCFDRPPARVCDTAPLERFTAFFLVAPLRAAMDYLLHLHIPGR
jgi:hypothetical protein